MCFRVELIADGKLPIISKNPLNLDWREYVNGFLFPAQRGLAVLSGMIMQSSAENTNSPINITAVGNFLYERQTQAGPYIAITPRGFGLIELIRS